MNWFNRSKGAVEVRAPKAALTNLTYRSPGSPMMDEWSAEEAFRYAYLSNIVVYSCVNLIAEDIARLPFRAGPSITEPTNFNEGAPLARLLGPPPGGPNPEMAANDLWANAVAQYLVTGRFGWELELAGKRIEALWPLAAQRLRVIPTASNSSKSNYFEGFLYGAPGDEKRLSYDEVFYCWKPALHDYRQAESALQAARLDISVAVMQDRYDHAFLKNDARPAALMIVRRFAEEAQYRAFKEQINAEYGGPDNSGKTMIVEDDGDENGSVTGSVEFKTLGISQKDAEFIKRHEQKFRNIAMALGVPWSKLDASGRTFDNADIEDITYEQSRVITLATKLQNRVNISLAPRVGREVGWFDLSTLKSSQPVKKFTQVSVVEAYATNLIDKTEARAEVGLKPMTPEQEAEFEVNEPEVPVLEPAPILELPIARGKRELELVNHDERKRKILASVDAQAEIFERQWIRTFKALFDKQLRESLKRLEGKRGRQMLKREVGDQIFDPEYWKSATIDEATRLYETVFAAGGARVADYFGFSFDVEAPYAQEFIMQRANKLAGQVTDTTYNAIKEQLVQGVIEGEGIPELSKRVQSVFEIASNSRAEMIARTEVLDGFNKSALAVAKELPADVVGGKEWIGSGDNDECSDFASRAPIGLAESWDGIDAAPAHPNCKCTIGLLSPEQFIEMTGGRSKLVPVTDITKRLARMATRERLKVVV